RLLELLLRHVALEEAARLVLNAAARIDSLAEHIRDGRDRAAHLERNLLMRHALVEELLDALPSSLADAVRPRVRCDVALLACCTPQLCDVTQRDAVLLGDLLGRDASAEFCANLLLDARRDLLPARALWALADRNA